MTTSSPTLKEAIAMIEDGKVAVPVVDAPQRLKEVAKLVLGDRKKLDTSSWFHPKIDAWADGADLVEIAHACGTTACIAGWAILQAGEDGKALLDAIEVRSRGISAEIAGYVLLGAEAEGHFYDNDEDALEYLKNVLQD